MIDPVPEPDLALRNWLERLELEVERAVLPAWAAWRSIARSEHHSYSLARGEH